MSKILITGASGFVGSFLVREALSRKLKVYAGVRSSSSLGQLQNPAIQFCEINYDDEKQIRTVLDHHQFDYIIHNAGITRAPSASIYKKVNTDYTNRLARLALEVNPSLKKFLFISSLEAFGSADGTPNDVVDEFITPNPRTQYGFSKQRAEQMLKEIPGLPYLILRPTGIFGPYEKDIFTVFKTIKKYRISPVVGSRKIKYSFIYVRDMVRVAMDACLSDISGKGYFVSDGKVYSIDHFNNAVATYFGVQTFPLVIPYPVMELAVGITGLYDKLSGNTSLLNREQLDKLKAQNWDCDISPLVKDFSFRPKYTLEEAIEETCEWYLANGWL